MQRTIPFYRLEKTVTTRRFGRTLWGRMSVSRIWDRFTSNLHSGICSRRITLRRPVSDGFQLNCLGHKPTRIVSRSSFEFAGVQNDRARERCDCFAILVVRENSVVVRRQCAGLAAESPGSSGADIPNDVRSPFGRAFPRQFRLPIPQTPSPHAWSGCGLPAPFPLLGGVQ